MVQPSRQEGYCLSMAEANSSKKPLIMPQFYFTSKEFIVHGLDGLMQITIVKSIYKKVKRTIR